MRASLASVAVVASFLVSLITCLAVRRFAGRRLLDIPNERSLHAEPVPRIGGVGIILGAMGTVGASMLWGGQPAHDSRAWLLAAASVATLGFVDDFKSLGAPLRLLVQTGIAALIYEVIGAPSTVVLATGHSIVLPAAVALFLWVVFIVGVVNIYNFMDGMDGLAATQAIGAGTALAVALGRSGQADLALIAVLVAAASAGFLLQNAPPAKLFMGDGGSTFLGFSFSTLALMGSARAPSLPISVVAIALAPFLLDGTFTIFRRLSRGEAIWRAHRSHLYQRAVATGLTHRDVLLPYAAWIAVAAATAVAAQTAGGWTTLLMAASLVLELGVVWRWVVRREQRRPAIS